MGVWEGIKDILGILDDAGDYVDRVKSEMEPINQLVTQLDREAKEIEHTLNMIRQSDDSDLAKDLLVKLDLNRPLLFGKAIGKRLVNARKELNDLKRHLSQRKAKAFKATVMPVITTAMRRLDHIFRQHGDMLKQISTLQVQRKKAIRAVLKIIAKGGVIAAGVSLISVIAGMFGGVMGVVGSSMVVSDAVATFTRTLANEWSSKASQMRDAAQGITL